MLNEKTTLAVSNNVTGALVVCVERCPGICLEILKKCIRNLRTNV
jgi:hypothetical protein